MASFFRSEKMELCQLFIQPEAAYASVAELGEAGTVQFRDLNRGVNAFQRKFVNEVRFCDELERKLRYIEAEIIKEEVPIPETGECPNAPNTRAIADLEAILEKTESEMLELSQNDVNLKSNFLELTEIRYVLDKTGQFFINQDVANGSEPFSFFLNSEDPVTQTSNARGRLEYIAGVIPREKVAAFERMLWRISRGNVFLRHAEIEEALKDPNSDKEILKNMFVAFFQGEQLKSRVKKVCTGFHASVYPCPYDDSEREEMMKGVSTRLEDLNSVLNQSQDHRIRVLLSVAKELPNWLIMVRKMKAIYHILNMFNVSTKYYVAECWIPVRDIPGVRKVLADSAKATGSSPSFMSEVATSEVPPTLNRTNKFTRGFQNLIDAYGVSCYREVNPALYTIITFPFLFAIMFGDVGHGLIVFGFGLFMVLGEKKIMAQKSDNEIWNIFFGGRYIILLMGIFSIYTGLIYNDIFSKSISLFGSSWKIVNMSFDYIENNSAIELDPATHFKDVPDYDGPYYFGMDPVWQLAANKIRFLNTYKMKLSIIFGVVHMILGVCLSVVNHVHFHKKINIILEFVPKILFLVLLFGYLVSMMFLKWILYYPQMTLQCKDEGVICTQDILDKIRYGTSCAPNILILFINMMLFKENPQSDPGCQEFMFDYQKELQMALVAIAVLCIPTLLLAKPLYVLFKRNTSTRKRNASKKSVTEQDMELTKLELVQAATSSNKEGERGEGEHGQEMEEKGLEMEEKGLEIEGEEEEEEHMGEIFIHQGIHTIEYILSTISHTASYLRLWALSLAHAQLSEVLWMMVLQKLALSFGGGDFATHAIACIMLYIMFGFWAILTVAILVLMEGLSAFLHTLRLHWVEFMNKFYEGDGYVFLPFAFKQILESGDLDEE